MKTCKNCGASINEDSRFCTNCGADTFADGAGNDTAVNAQASAQPQTDYTSAPDQSGEVYYQPAGGNTVNSGDYYQPNGNNNASPYTYTAPANQSSAGKKKGKGGVVAIILVVVIVVGGVLVGIGSKASDLFGNLVGSDSSLSISSGYDTATEYINSSVNLKIDTSKGDMEIMSSQYESYYGVSSGDYETFICDIETGENIYVAIFEGSFYETSQDIKEFAVETAEYWYQDYEDCVISDAYERVIGGNTYTCVDISETVESEDYGSYYYEETVCFLKSGSTFFEIDIILYPEETGNTADTVIDTYFSEYK